MASGLSDAAGLDAFDRLSAAYAEPHRHYHNAQHINECLEEFDNVRTLATNPIAVEFAIWFHDAIYNPHATDNEEQSAILAAEFNDSAEVRALILATKHAKVPHDSEAKLLVDVDLAILGKSARFWEYDAQIRREYAFVPLEIYQEKRAKILEKFLARPALYQLDYFQGRYEEKARANLREAIQRLRGRDS